jgi:hypothetical protein
MKQSRQNWVSMGAVGEAVDLAARTRLMAGLLLALGAPDESVSSWSARWT